MSDAPQLFMLMATTEEISDASSWVNNNEMPFRWAQEWQNKICQNLGEMLAAWAEVETYLHAIYVFSTCGSNHDPNAEWIEATGFRLRLQKTDAALRCQERASFSLKNWDALHRKIEKKSRCRNGAVHGRIMFDYHAKKGHRKMFISTPVSLKPLKTKLYGTDLIRYRDDFIALAADLASFHGQLMKNIID